MEKSSENSFTLGAHQESNSSNFRTENLIPKGKSNAPTIYQFGSIYRILDKNMSESFNLLSDGEESDLEMLSDNEIDLSSSV
ncbi:hypothetical protein TNCV_1408341 [Trichonephila clavipes]|nr:hypothetical protein TNCV_1408341 [Trichonephila clavipes]